MTKTEFQAEAVATAEPIATPTTKPQAPSTVTAESVLLGLTLRPWLTDDEHQFLDDLAPEPALSFLIQDGRYLHPADVPLFDIEQLGSVVSQAGDAIFTQRCEHTNGERKGIYHIHWANLAPNSEQSLLFGLFGPIDRMSSPTAINRFYKLVADLRRAYADAARVAEHVTPSLDNGSAGMVVDRNSGTILCANANMARLCNMTADDMVGRSVQDIPLESDTTGQRSLTMENIDQSHYHLCLIRTGRTLAMEDDGDPVMAAQFIHAMRNKLTGIQAAASELAIELSPNDQAMVTTVLSEAAALRDQVSRFDLLLSYRNRTNRPIKLVNELSKAVQVANEAGSRIDIRDSSDGNMVVRAPDSAWETLFSAILERHTTGRRAGNARVLVSDEGSETVITTVSAMDNRTRVKPFLGQFINRLASLLGAAVTMMNNDEARETTTEVRCTRMN